MSVWSCDASVRPGVNGTSTVDAGVPGGLLDGRRAGQHDQVGQRDLLAAGLGGVEGLLDSRQGAQHDHQLVGVVDLPPALRLEADAGAVGAAALVAAAEGRGRRPRGRHELRHRQARGEDLALEGGDVAGVDELVRHRRDRVLPDQRLGRDLRAEVAHDRAHVTMGQLEPGAGEGVRELIGVLHEAPRDRLVDRVEPEREVGRQHRRRAALRRVLRVWDGVRPGAVLRLPLVGARRALGQLPLEAEESLEEAVVPRGRRGSPGDLEAAGDRVGAHTRAVAALPAQALLLERGRLGIGADVALRTRAVGLAEGVTARDQGDRLLVVHRHPAERLADVAGRGERVRVAVRPLRVDVDEAHLDRAERVGELAVAAVALVIQPGRLRTPVDVLLGLPGVHPAAAEAERLETHRLQGDVAGEDHEVGPGDLPAVLLLDRPQQPPRLVQADVVRPAVERREALLAGTGAAAAVADPVGARAVPGHPDHQRAVVAEVGRPPVLGVCQHRGDVALHRGQVKAAERLGVVEVLPHGVRHGGVLGQDLQVEPARPPLAVGVTRGGMDAAGQDRAFPFGSRTFGDYGVMVLGHANPSVFSG